MFILKLLCDFYLQVAAVFPGHVMSNYNNIISCIWMIFLEGREM